VIINQTNLAVLFTGYSAAFKGGLESAPKHWDEVALQVPSSTDENIYPWLSQLPGVREWIGSRVIKNLGANSFRLKNKDFEATFSVPRNAIEDDSYGAYGPIVREIGLTAGDHPNELAFSLLAAGFTTLCYDGQFFFDTDHPVGDGEAAPVSVSNMQAGAGPAWFLLDTSRALKPLIYQLRRPYQLVSKTNPDDDNVFFNKEFIYGADGRSVAGFGLWQLAFGSKATLDAANYKAARQAMMGFKGDGGRPLNINPKVLVVPPALEEAAMTLLNTEYGAGGATNVWKGTAKPIVTAWLV